MGSQQQQQQQVMEIRAEEPQTVRDDRLQFLINLQFSGNQQLSRAWPGVSILIGLEKWMRQDTTRRSMAQELERCWPVVSNEQRHQIIETAWSKARQAVARMPPSHNVVNLHFQVNVEEEDINVVGGRMVPAIESSIENLERKKIMADWACPVCLEENYSEEEVVCMPCSHIFHGDCINKWLRTSHYCPLCRFQMPTS